LPNAEKRGEVAGNAATAGWTGATAGVDVLAALVLSVCAGCGQLMPQQSRAAAASGESICICASLQQSIMPVMLHSLSFECSGTPASTLTPSARTSAKAESRFIITNEDYIEQPTGLSIHIETKAVNPV
jgi:hypothetical protein